MPASGANTAAPAAAKAKKSNKNAAKPTQAAAADAFSDDEPELPAKRARKAPKRM